MNRKITAITGAGLAPFERRLLHNFAQGLCSAHQINPQHRTLVPVLGTGAEASNLEAVNKWVCWAALTSDLSLEPQTFHHLQDRLGDYLSRWELER